MATQTGAPHNSAASPPPPPPPADQEIAEEKIEQVQVELAKPEKIDSEPKEEKMEKPDELLKSQDEAEDKQIDPQEEAKQEEKADAPASEVPHLEEEDKEEAEKKQAELDSEEKVQEAATTEVELEKPTEEQVKVEIVEENLEETTEKKGNGPEVLVEVDQKEKERLEVSADKEQGEKAEAVEETEVSKEEVSIEDKRPSEEPTEAIQASDPLEAVLEHEKTSEAAPVEEPAEQKPENPAQDEKAAEDFKAPVLVEEPQSQAEDENTELKDVVEENPVKDVGGETADKVEALRVEEVEKIEASRAEEVVASDKEVESEAQSEVVEVDEKTIEEIKPRESLGTLMKMEEDRKDEFIEEKIIENSNNVVAVDEQVQAEDKDVRVSVPETADNEATQDLSEPKEVIQAIEELEPEVKKAEQNEQGAEEDKLVEKEVVTNGSVHASKEATEDSVDVACASADAELPSEKKIEEAKQETEITAPIENGTDEGKTRDLSASEENKDPENVEGKSLSDPRALEEVKPEEKSIRDVDEAKDTQDQPKEEAPAKPVSKQSNNIISKMKHSLVKAKKAIIGKSPSSKSISTTTGDIKVK